MKLILKIIIGVAGGILLALAIGLYVYFRIEGEESRHAQQAALDAQQAYILSYTLTEEEIRSRCKSEYADSVIITTNPRTWHIILRTRHVNQSWVRITLGVPPATADVAYATPEVKTLDDLIWSPISTDDLLHLDPCLAGK